MVLSTGRKDITPADAWNEIQERLRFLRVRDRNVSLIQGLLLLTAATLCLAVGTGILEALFRLSPMPRLIICVLTVAALIVIFTRYCITPWLSKLSDDILAARVDRRFPELHDSVTMTLQLWRQREAGIASRQSAGLLDAAITASARSTVSADFNEADRRERIPKALRFLGVIAVISLATFGFLFAPLASAFVRLSNPLTDFPVPQRTFLSVSPGDTEVSMGESLTVTVTTTGDIPREARLLSTTTSGLNEELLMAGATASTFSVTLRALNDNLTYSVRAGDAESPEYEISVVDRPTVADLSLTYQYPAYTRIAPRTTADGTGDILAITGTKVTIDLEASQPLQAAFLQMGQRGDEFPMTVVDAAAEASLVVSSNDTYQIHLTNGSGRNNGIPPQYRITALTDRRPDIRIISPGENTDLNENMMVPLVLSATDDFGFASMNLVFQKVTESDAQRRFIAVDRSVTNFTVPFVWDLSDLDLIPEDVLSYYVEVFDNDTIGGPKRAVTQTFAVRFPSLAEIYEELDSRQEEQVSDLQDMLKEQEEAQKQLQELNRELEQSEQQGEDEELTWEEKKKVESLVEKQEQMAENVLKSAEAMQEAMEQANQQDMMDPELLEKMNQLRKMFQEIATPELMDAMKNVKESMQNMDEAQMAEAMKDFEKAQEEFKKRLERSLSILKRMRAEQQMESAIQKAADLVERQEELQYATQNDSENPSDAARKSLSEKQSELSKDAESMRQDLETLAKSMEEADAGMPEEQIQDTAESMERQEVSQQMQQVSQQLSKGQMKQAQQGQQQVSQQLSQVSEQLQEAQSQMKQEQQQEIAAEMRQAMYSLLDLSQGQEDLQNRTSNASGQESRLDAIVEDQNSLLNGTAQVADALVGTSQKTFFVSPEVGKTLGESLTHMQDATRGLSERNRGNAAEQQSGAMESLNQTVLTLQQAMNDMNASGSSSGMMEMLQQLQSMSQQQSGVNDELNQMMQHQQGEGQSGQQQMSMDERARMSRLAQQQEQIRKSLEQMQREQRQQADVLGRLSEIEREMKESVRQMSQQQMDPKLLERQQRILSRLLDASKSMRERDYKDERKATAGESLADRPSPAELPPGLLDYAQPVRDDLLKGGQSGTYPSAYEQLIRAYFRALAEEPREN